MAKYTNCPTIYNRLTKLSIGSVKAWGYLDKAASGVITFNNGVIGISSYRNDTGQYIEFNYIFNGCETKYKVALIKKQSNLGNGFYYYFECPLTKKLCRKLYLIDGYFLHREAVKGFYQCQVWSKQSRKMASFFKLLFEDDVTEKPFFRETYNGKETKRYLADQKKWGIYVEKYGHLLTDNAAHKEFFGF